MEWITDIKNSIERIETTIQGTVATYQKISLFLEHFFTLIPPDVLLLYIVLSLFLIFMNNLSPQTPRINISILLVLYTFVRLQFNQLFYSEWHWQRVLVADLYVILPVFGLSFFRFFYKFLTRRLLKKGAASLRLNFHNIKKSMIQTELLLLKEPIDQTELKRSLSEIETQLTDFRSDIEKMR